MFPGLKFGFQVGPRFPFKNDSGSRIADLNNRPQIIIFWKIIHTHLRATIRFVLKLISLASYLTVLLYGSFILVTGETGNWLAYSVFMCLILMSVPYWSNFATVSLFRKLREVSFDLRGYRFDPNLTNHRNVKVSWKFECPDQYVLNHNLLRN